MTRSESSLPDASAAHQLPHPGVFSAIIVFAREGERGGLFY